MHQVVVVVRVVLLLLLHALVQGLGPTVMPDCSLFWDSVCGLLAVGAAPPKLLQPVPLPSSCASAGTPGAGLHEWLAPANAAPRPGLGGLPAAWPSRPAGGLGLPPEVRLSRSPRRRGGRGWPSDSLLLPLSPGTSGSGSGADPFEPLLWRSLSAWLGARRGSRGRQRRARAVGRAPPLLLLARPAPPRARAPVELPAGLPRPLLSRRRWPSFLRVPDGQRLLCGVGTFRTIGQARTQGDKATITQ